MIFITFALPTETSGLIKQLGGKQTSYFNRDKIIYGKINVVPVGIFHTGVGAKTCQPRMANLLRNVRPDLLISAGFAGSTSDEFTPGDLILAENFSNKRFLDEALQILSAQNVRAVRIFTATRIIDSREERNRIARDYEAAAVDMETEGIAFACAAYKVPLLSLRIISDSVSEPLPAPPQVLFDIEEQRTDYTKLVAHMLRHPGAIRSLFRFSRRIARAREALTEALLALVQGL